MADAEAHDLIARVRDDPGRTGVFCDFDGTLAEIVDRPDDAVPVEGAVDALAALTAAYARVVVISGRPGRFLQSHLGDRGILLAGLYGLEMVRDGEIEVAEEARRWESEVQAAIDRIGERAPDGLRIEGKGLTVTLHFRAAPELAEEVRALAHEEAEVSGLVVVDGRQSFELRPPVATSKGTVLAEVAADLEAAVFLGDDTGDLTAFDALDEIAGRGGRALRVAVRSSESPPELLERADVVVDGPREVVELLRRLDPAADS